MQDVLDEPLDSKPERNTIFHELRDSTLLPQQEKSLDRLADESNILIAAGSETTAGVLSVLCYHLLSNPSILAKLRIELDEVMPTSIDNVSWKQLEQLPLLGAVINEGLRIASPVTSRLPRIAPLDELEYHGWTIPAGVCFYIHTIRHC